jgi:hyaluronan synthase
MEINYLYHFIFQLGLPLSIIFCLIYDIVFDIGGILILSVYGIIILSYLFTMIFLSNKNNSIIQNIINFNIDEEYKNYNLKKTCGIVSCYREDEKYFIECLESLKKQNFNKIFVIIDGNDPNDYYLVDIFKFVFNEDSIVVNLDNTLSDKYKKILIGDYKYICITQPHKGKRHAMFTGFKLAIENNIDLAITIDSDTIFEENAVNYLIKTFNDKRVGGVTGNLNIFNDNTFISYLSKLRYWYAFNFERAFGSSYGGVLCLSGPISCYKVDIIEKCLNKWLYQTFLNKRCTYGDDRHLTNCILQLGYKTYYNPYAIAFTETPETFERFVKQQTRWTKSAYRELLWVFKFIYNNNPLMSFDLTYQYCYPILVSVLLSYSVWQYEIYKILLYVWIIFSISFIKSIIGYIKNKNIIFLLFFNYSLLYITIIIPIKLYALLTLSDTSWGNIGRISNNIKFGQYFNNASYNNIIFSSIIIGIYLLGFKTIYILSKFKYSNIYSKIKKRNFSIDKVNKETFLDIIEHYYDTNFDSIEI